MQLNFYATASPVQKSLRFILRSNIGLFSEKEYQPSLYTQRWNIDVSLFIGHGVKSILYFNSF